jgi:PucR family transcriptional regulator, purine catabolism regulatory protein
MLTVSDTLQLDALRGARVVAGRGGIHNPVAWVHVAGVPDAPAWLNGGELVLTTFINMPNDADEQDRYVQAMADKGVAALALAIGRYVEAAPDHMRAVADRNDFPLIEIPFQARFVDIAKVVNERITQENMAMVQRALTIHRVLTQLVLDGGDLKDLAEKLAGLVGQSVSIENERFEALASANIAPVDEARRYTLTEGRTDPRLVRALEDRGVLGEIQRTLRPVSLPQMPDVGLEMERILAPIVVHGDIYGYVWIIADDRPLNELDHVAIESGATIAALILLHQEAVLVAEASLKGGLLSQLIQREAGHESVLADQALRYGLDLSAPYTMLVTEAADRSSQKLLQLYRRVNRLAGTQEWPAVVGQFAGQVVIMVQADAGIPQIAESIIAQSSGGVRVGVSAEHRGTPHVPIAHTQCLDTLFINRRLNAAQRVVYFDELGYLHALYRAGVDSLSYNPHVPGLRKLLPEQQADLFHTLEVYLDAGGNGVATAELLSIARSTLNYRLARIAEVCAVDLGDPLARTNLQVALKLMRLFEVE